MSCDARESWTRITCVAHMRTSALSAWLSGSFQLDRRNEIQAPTCRSRRKQGGRNGTVNRRGVEVDAHVVLQIDNNLQVVPPIGSIIGSEWANTEDYGWLAAAR